MRAANCAARSTNESEIDLCGRESGGRFEHLRRIRVRQLVGRSAIGNRPHGSASLSGQCGSHDDHSRRPAAAHRGQFRTDVAAQQGVEFFEKHAARRVFILCNNALDGGGSAISGHAAGSRVDRRSPAPHRRPCEVRTTEPRYAGLERRNSRRNRQRRIDRQR